MILLNKLWRRYRRLIRSMQYASMAPAPCASPGSPEWLVAAEMKYGGYVTNVPRRKVSAADPRSKLSLQVGGMTGGDRMFHHGYADVYAEHLEDFVSRRLQPLTIAEVGVLCGSGLAVWSELFPNATIIGLDIDLSHFRESLPQLKAHGAFANAEPEAHVFDQFLDGQERFGEILQQRTVDIFVDDGFHSNETIMNTFRAAVPFLSETFVYFIEDNDRVAALLAAAYPEKTVLSYGEITVVKSPAHRCE